jgi:hypothetical protein
MTNDATRVRGLLVMLGVFVPLTVVATAATPDNRLFTAVAMTTAFAVLIVVVMVAWSYRPAWFVEWSGPLKDLDLEHRRLVMRAVRSGQTVADPTLAPVAAAVAGRTARSAWLMIGAGGLSVAIRVWSLAGSHGATARLLGLLSTALWLGYLAFGVHRLVRARRAEAANRQVLTRA